MADRLGAIYGPKGGALKTVSRAGVIKKKTQSQRAPAPIQSADSFDVILPSGRPVDASTHEVSPPPTPVPKTLEPERPGSSSSSRPGSLVARTSSLFKIGSFRKPKSETAAAEPAPSPVPIAPSPAPPRSARDPSQDTDSDFSDDGPVSAPVQQVAISSMVAELSAVSGAFGGEPAPPESPLRDRTRSLLRQAQALRRSGSETLDSSSPSPPRLTVVDALPSPPSPSLRRLTVVDALPPPPSPSLRRPTVVDLPPPPSPNVRRPTVVDPPPPPPDSPPPQTRVRRPTPPPFEPSRLPALHNASSRPQVLSSPFLQACFDLCAGSSDNPFKDRNLSHLNATHLATMVEKIMYSKTSVQVGMRFTALPTDIVVVGMPRSGLTPVCHMLDSLRYKALTPRATLPERVFWLEGAYVKDLPPFGLGRIVRSHLPLRHFFESQLGRAGPQGKIVVVLRDLLDLRVSWFRLVRRLTKKLATGYTDFADFDSFFHADSFVSAPAGACAIDGKDEDLLPEGIYVSLARHLRDANVHIVFYEDVVAHPLDVLRALQVFSGLGDAASVPAIAEAFKREPLHPSQRLRKGSCGAGVKMLSKANQRLIDASWDRLIKMPLKHHGYEGFYEAMTHREFPLGNRARPLEDDLKQSVKNSSYTTAVTATSGRRVTNLGEEEFDKSNRSPSFLAFTAASMRGLVNGDYSSLAAGTPGAGASKKTDKALELIDPDDSDVEQLPWSKTVPRDGKSTGLY